MHQILTRIFTHTPPPTHTHTHKPRFPIFHYRTSSFGCLPICSSLEPSQAPTRDNQLSIGFESLLTCNFMTSKKISSSPSSQRYMQFQWTLVFLPKLNQGFNGNTYKEILLLMVTSFFRICTFQQQSPKQYIHFQRPPPLPETSPADT